MLLGLAIITISMGTLKANVEDATTNDSYYAADSGVDNGLDQLELEVSRYYTTMAAASGTSYTALYNNFAANIAAYAKTNFAEPAVSSGSTNTTFTVSGYDSATNIYDFLVTTVSTMADGTKYKVQGTLKVKRVDISLKDWYINNAAVVAGGVLDLNSTCGMTVNGSNVIVGDLTYVRSWNPCQITGGMLIKNPLIGDSINDVLRYPSFSTPTVSNPSPYITTNNTVINWSTALTNPVRIDTAAGVNITITQAGDSGIPAGIIRGRGNVTVKDTSPVYSDIYCDGDFNAASCTLNGDIYVHGNLIINNGVFNSDVYCDGNITLYSGSLKGNVYCNGSITISNASAIGSMFATGPISIGSAGTSSGIIYSRTKVTMGSNSATAVVFSGGDIVFNGSGNLTGMFIAKNNINYLQSSTWYTVNYDATTVNNILNDPDNAFFRKGQGTAELNTDVFQGHSITALGRIN